MAGVVAYCNAAASAQLATVHPTSGGTYIYGRRQLGEWPGFLAGWAFITGKTASCAAMALAFGLYAAPGQATAVAVAAVVLLTGVNLLGITRTAWMTRWFISVVAAVLVFVDRGRLQRTTAGAPARRGPQRHRRCPAAARACFRRPALFFFAFAGYARIATLGEEVRDPTALIPRAILSALAGVFVMYLRLGRLLRCHAAGAAGHLDGAAAGHGAVAAPRRSRFVQAGAAAACLGALLALIAGVAGPSWPWHANTTCPARWPPSGTASRCPGWRSWPWGQR